MTRWGMQCALPSRVIGLSSMAAMGSGQTCPVISGKGEVRISGTHSLESALAKGKTDGRCQIPPVRVFRTRVELRGRDQDVGLDSIERIAVDPLVVPRRPRSRVRASDDTIRPPEEIVKSVVWHEIRRGLGI